EHQRNNDTSRDPPLAVAGSRRHPPAVGIDFASVESAAFCCVAEDSMRRIELGETLSRMRIVLVGIRMQLLRQLSERPLDVVGGRRPRYRQGLIGIVHLERSQYSPARNQWN